MKNLMKNLSWRGLILDSASLTFLASVILVAITQPTDEQSLELGRNSLIVLVLFVLAAIFAVILNRSGLKTMGEQLFEPDHLKAQSEEVSWYKTFWGWQLTITLLVTFFVGLIKVKFSLFEMLDKNGFDGMMRLMNGLFHPNWAVLPRAVLNIFTTIFMAFIATALAIPFAFVLSFLCAKNIMKSRGAFSVYLILRTILNITRSVEALVWAIIFSVWVGIGPFAGMLALMIHSIASLAKQYSEMVENVNVGPIEGIQATGASKLQTIWFAIVPQVLLPYISFTIYRWDINVRMATIIGLVGGGGIGTMLMAYQQQGMWAEVGTIIVVIATVVWIMDQASAYIREALK